MSETYTEQRNASSIDLQIKLTYNIFYHEYFLFSGILLKTNIFLKN